MMLQYGFIINAAANSFAWDNVYAYLFHEEIEEFPERDWDVINHNNWSLLHERFN